jgi:hypothetical protein
MTDSRGLRELVAGLIEEYDEDMTRPPSFTRIADLRAALFANPAPAGHPGHEGIDAPGCHECWMANHHVHDARYVGCAGCLTLAANPAPAGLTSTDQLDAEQRGLPIPFANPAPPGLDVERLHTALGHVGFGGFSRDNVKAIAAEYARLGSAAEKK